MFHHYIIRKGQTRQQEGAAVDPGREGEQHQQQHLARLHMETDVVHCCAWDPSSILHHDCIALFCCLCSQVLASLFCSTPLQAFGPRGPKSLYYMLPWHLRVYGLTQTLSTKMIQVLEAVLDIRMKGQDWTMPWTLQSSHIWTFGKTAIARAMSMLWIFGHL